MEAGGVEFLRSDPSVVKPRYRSASGKRRFCTSKASSPRRMIREASEGEKLARLAGALDYKRRVEQAALLTVQELRAEDKAVPRASTTDADARVMKMPDGGYRPGYNVRLATAGSELGGPRTIVGLLVTNVGSDMGSVTPMLADVESRTGQLPKQLLADAPIMPSTRASRRQRGAG